MDEKVVLFPTLEREIAGRGIKKKDIAKCIGISYKAFYNKLTGEAPFTWPEVCGINERFFPDMRKEDLFARADDTRDGA